MTDDLRNLTMSDAPADIKQAKIQSTLGNVTRALSFAAQPATATPSAWAGKAWGIDVSRYQAKILPLADGCIDFGIAKLGGSEYAEGVGLDPMFASHVQSIYDCKAIPMAYWYVDSGWYTRTNHSWGDLDKFTTENHPILSKIIEGLRAGNGWKFVKALFFDVETLGAGDAWNKHYIEDLRGRIVDLQKEGKFPQLKLGIYSRKSFMDSSPDLSNWVAQHPEIIVWTANYLKAFPGTFKRLAEHRESLPTVHNPMWYGDNPAKPKEFKRCWQYHGSFPGAMNATCPEILGGSGAPSALDLNVWECDRAYLHTMLGVVDRLGQVEPPPDDDDDEEPPTGYVSQEQFDALAERVDEQGAALAQLMEWARNVGLK